MQITTVGLDLAKNVFQVPQRMERVSALSSRWKQREGRVRVPGARP